MAIALQVVRVGINSSTIALTNGPDTIADFNVNEDMLVLTNLFAALNYNGIDPIADGYLQFVQDGSRTRVQVDPDSIQGAFPFTTIASTGKRCRHKFKGGCSQRNCRYI
jgi:hypothetical protein